MVHKIFFLVEKLRQSTTNGYNICVSMGNATFWIPFVQDHKNRQRQTVRG